MRYRQMIQRSTFAKKQILTQQNLERERAMTSKLIQLEDGTLVQVEVTGDEVQRMSGGAPTKVKATLARIQPVLLTVCNPIVEAVKNLRENVDLEHVEVEVALSFNADGNIFVAKTSFGTNILVRMTLTKKESA